MARDRGALLGGATPRAAGDFGCRGGGESGSRYRSVKNQEAGGVGSGVCDVESKCDRSSSGDWVRGRTGGGSCQCEPAAGADLAYEGSPRPGQSPLIGRRERRRKREGEGCRFGWGRQHSGGVGV